MSYRKNKELRIEVPLGSGFRIGNNGYRATLLDPFIALGRRLSNNPKCCDGCCFAELREDCEKGLRQDSDLIDYIPLPCRHFLCHENERSDNCCIIFIKDDTVGKAKTWDELHPKLDINDLKFNQNYNYPTSISLTGELQIGFDGTISSPKYEVEPYRIEPEIQIEYRWEL